MKVKQKCEDSFHLKYEILSVYLIVILMCNVQ